MPLIVLWKKYLLFLLFLNKLPDKPHIILPNSFIPRHDFLFSFSVIPFYVVLFYVCVFINFSSLSKCTCLLSSP